MRRRRQRSTQPKAGGMRYRRQRGLREGKAYLDHDPWEWPGVVLWLPLVFGGGLFLGAVYAIARGGFLDIITGRVTAGWLLGLALFALEYAVVGTVVWIVAMVYVNVRMRFGQGREERMAQDAERQYAERHHRHH